MDDFEDFVILNLIWADFRLKLHILKLFKTKSRKFRLQF